jgi:hypothetical protein
MSKTGHGLTAQMHSDAKKRCLALLFVAGPGQRRCDETTVLIPSKGAVLRKPSPYQKQNALTN